jgi:phosphoenolpyruvate carboxylase
MIEATRAATPAPMRQFVPAIAEPSPRATRLLGERMELVEDLWQTVLRSECPPEQAERLLRLKRLSDPCESGEGSDSSAAIVELIQEMDLA